MPNAYFVRLGDRGRVRIAGPDRLAFLQSLITNDIGLMKTQPVIYACFLSAQGKYLHDFFVSDDGEALTLECEAGERAERLMKGLKLYKLRSKIELSCEPAVSICAIFGDGTTGYQDPRHASLGRRLAGKAPDLPEKPFAAWDEHRIRLGVPDGSRDMLVDKDTVLECNLDKLNGVSFSKGCYVGQEITARMHLRNIIKKRLRVVILERDAPAPGTDIHINGQLAGQMRSHCGAVGLAMIRDDALDLLADGPVRLLRDAETAI
jgi:tRNA-modifying protein YgfZ